MNNSKLKGQVCLTKIIPNFSEIWHNFKEENRNLTQSVKKKADLGLSEKVYSIRKFTVLVKNVFLPSFRVLLSNMTMFY